MLSLLKRLFGHRISKDDFVKQFPDGLARWIGKNKESGYVNYENELVIRLTDESGKIVFVTDKDINWEDETVKEYERSVRSLWPSYYFSGDNFRNGIALVTWTVLPDGRYFEDEDGFGGENNNEVNIYCFIDKSGKVVVPFQGMTEEHIEEYRKKAENIKA